MTELETLERARMCLQSLANGINPIDGTDIPDGDIVNNIRLSRCFFYVADVLRRVIDNGGVHQPRAALKAPFSLSLNQRDSFAYSDVPIPISEVAKRINALIGDENMKKLSYRTIRDWLLSLGMLESVPDGDGKMANRPTKQGESLGIHLDNRMGANGPYVVVVYNPAAQQFILEKMNNGSSCLI